MASSDRATRASGVPPEDRVLFVHGIGEKRQEALAGASWAGKSVDRLSRWMVERQPLQAHDVRLQVDPCPPGCVERLQHRHVTAQRGDAHVRSWCLVAVTWAHEIDPPPLGVFIRWLLSVLGAAAVWHAIAAVVRLRRAVAHAQRLVRSRQPHKVFWSQFVVVGVVGALVWAVVWRSVLVLAALPVLALATVVGISPRGRRRLVQLPLLDSHAWLTGGATERRICATVRSALVPGTGRPRPPRTLLVAHSQGAAVAARTLDGLSSADRRASPLTLLTLGSGAGYLGMLGLVAEDRDLRRAALSLAASMAVAGAVLGPVTVVLTFELVRILLLALWGAGAHLLALAVASQHPQLALRTVEPVTRALAEGLQAALARSGPPPSATWPLAVLGTVIGLNLMVIGPVGVIARWRQSSRPPDWVDDWIDVHASHDLVSSSQTLLHDRPDEVTEVGQSASLADHVRYFSNEASVLPLLLSVMVRDTALADDLVARAAAARRVQRAAVASAVTLRRVLCVVAALLLVVGAPVLAAVLALVAQVSTRVRVRRSHGRLSRSVIGRTPALAREAELSRRWRHSLATESLLVLGLLLGGTSLAAGTAAVELTPGSRAEAVLLEGWLWLSAAFLALALVWLVAWDLVRRAAPRCTETVVAAAGVTCAGAAALADSAGLAWAVGLAASGAAVLHGVQVGRSRTTRGAVPGPDGG